jgi:hypothetical protein
MNLVTCIQCRIQCLTGVDKVLKPSKTKQHAHRRTLRVEALFQVGNFDGYLPGFTVFHTHHPAH